MALSRSQENSIKLSINHLLEFSQDNNLFLLAEIKLMSALTTTVPNDHEFYWLSECFKKPQYYFQGLENQGPATTVGTVQNFIIDHIEESLSSTNNKFSCWDKSKILALLPKKNWQTAYKSEDAFVEEGDNPHQLPDLPGKNYTQNFYTNQKNGEIQAYLEVSVSIPGRSAIKQSIKFEKLRQDFENDLEEDEYMDKILNDAAEEAKYMAIWITINALKKKKIILRQTIKPFMDSTSNKDILTSDYWSGLLFKYQLDFSKIMQLTNTEYENLSEPSLIDLHKNNTFTFDEIKSLTPPARIIAKNPVFYASLKNKSIKLEDIINISKRRAKLLVHPNITYLVQNNKLTFTEAKYLPYHLNPILTSACYSTFFRNNIIDWKEFEKIKAAHCDMMLKPYMVCLISNKILTLQNLTSAMNMYPNPEKTFFQLLATSAAKRLYRIFAKRPSRLNSTIDTFDHVIGELPHIAAACKKDTGVFKERTLLKFLAFLDMKVKKNIQALMPDDPRIVIYHNMQKIIQKSHGSKNKPEAVLDELHEFAVETLKSIPASEGNNSVTSYTITFYLKKRKVPSLDTDVKDFCDAVIALTQSTQNQSVLTKTIVR